MDSSYRNQAQKQLRNCFRRLSCAVIDHALLSTGFNFVQAFHRLSDIEGQRGNTCGDGKGAFDGIPERHRHWVFIKSNRTMEHFNVTNGQLHTEIAAIMELGTNAAPTRPEVVDITFTPKKNTEIVKPGDVAGGVDQDVEIIECLCCYVDYPVSQMRECTPGSGNHWCEQCYENTITTSMMWRGFQ